MQLRGEVCKTKYSKNVSRWIMGERGHHHERTNEKERYFQKIGEGLSASPHRKEMGEEFPNQRGEVFLRIPEEGTSKKGGLCFQRSGSGCLSSVSQFQSTYVLVLSVRSSNLSVPS